MTPMQTISKVVITLGFATLLILFNQGCGDGHKNGGFVNSDGGSNVDGMAMSDGTMTDGGTLIDASGEGDSSTVQDASNFSDSMADVDAVEADAAELDAGLFACSIEMIPDLTFPSLTIAGQIRALPDDPNEEITGEFNYVANAQLSFIDENGTTIGSDTSFGDFGAYELSISPPSSPDPVDGHVHITHADYLNQRFYFSTPISTDNYMADFEMISQTAFTEFLNFLEEPFIPNKGALKVKVLDCDGAPLMGATISTEPVSGRIIYLVYDETTGNLDLTASQTGTTGEAIIYQVPTGQVTVTAVYQTDTLRPRTVTINPLSAQTTTSTEISPHGSAFE